MSHTWTTLVQAEELAAALAAASGDDPVVVDTRFTLGALAAGEAAYRDGHVPGARYAHLDRDLSDAVATAVPGSGRHPWPRSAAFVQVLSRLGIAPAHQVVVYDGGDGAYAARLWFALRAFGHRRVAVLDGGFARWQALGLPVDANVPPQGTLPAATWPAAFDTTRLLDADDVRRHLARGGLLLDARAAERFRGDVEPIDRKAGHVPGAVNRPYARNLEDGRFKSAARLAEEFGALLGAQAPAEVVAMCGSGVTACHHLLAMAHAGLPGAKLFTGSWSGWIEDDARPVAHGDAASDVPRA